VWVDFDRFGERPRTTVRPFDDKARSVFRIWISAAHRWPTALLKRVGFSDPEVPRRGRNYPRNFGHEVEVTADRMMFPFKSTRLPVVGSCGSKPTSYL
jgi:hypothetical protein